MFLGAVILSGKKERDLLGRRESSGFCSGKGAIIFPCKTPTMWEQGGDNFRARVWSPFVPWNLCRKAHDWFREGVTGKRFRDLVEDCDRFVQVLWVGQKRQSGNIVWGHRKAFSLLVRASQLLDGQVGSVGILLVHASAWLVRWKRIWLPRDWLDEKGFDSHWKDHCYSRVYSSLFEVRHFDTQSTVRKPSCVNTCWDSRKYFVCVCGSTVALVNNFF